LGHQLLQLFIGSSFSSLPAAPPLHRVLSFWHTSFSHSSLPRRPDRTLCARVS
jgi:uncharacterized protein Usg